MVAENASGAERASSAPAGASLYRITLPQGRKSFSAGFTLEGDHVTACAPILRKWVGGRSLKYIEALCKEREWQLERVP